MLFYLKYIEHDVEKLQELLVYFFDKVEEVNPTTFDRTTLLPDWYNDYCNQPRRQGMVDLTNRLSEFIAFDNSVKTRIIQAFREANEIEQFFSDKTLSTPTKFDFDADVWRTESRNGNDVNIMMSTFLQELFADYLYKTQLGGKTSTFSKIIGKNLSEHYDKFKTEANYEDLEYLVCPFCGLEKMKDAKNIGRPDYDHLLPKSEFVFSSVNMKNLIPAGNDCNKIKNAHSLLHTDQALQNRTLAFYPYSERPHPFEKFTFGLTCIRQSTKNDKGEWQVEITADDSDDTDLSEKIETWNRVYKIKDRYAKFICDNHRNLIDGEFKITSINTINDLSSVMNEQLNRLPYSYFFLVTQIDVIPKRIFYQWALSNEDYLQRFIDANNLASTTTDYSDFE